MRDETRKVSLHLRDTEYPLLLCGCSGRAGRHGCAARATSTGPRSTAAFVLSASANSTTVAIHSTSTRTKNLYRPIQSLHFPWSGLYPQSPRHSGGKPGSCFGHHHISQKSPSSETLSARTEDSGSRRQGPSLTLSHRG